MKKLIFLFILLVAVPVMGFTKPKPEIKIGYWILTYNKEQGYWSTTTTQLVDVYTIAEIAAPGNCIDFSKKLKESVKFEFDDGNKSFLVEVRKINKRSKFKSLNRKEIEEYLK